MLDAPDLVEEDSDLTMLDVEMVDAVSPVPFCPPPFSHPVSTATTETAV